MDRFIGIDVAKATLDIAALPEGDTWSVTNDEPGLAELVPRLVLLAPTLVVLVPKISGTKLNNTP